MCPTNTRTRHEQEWKNKKEVCFMEMKDLDIHPRLGFQSSQATDSDVHRGSSGTKTCTDAELTR